jgi:hypothetical protein
VSAYVFAHNHSSVDGSESFAHNADLFGGDVVDIHEDALGESVAAVLNCGPDLVLGCLSVFLDGHIYYDSIIIKADLLFEVKNDCGYSRFLFFQN